jgi:hypothetical protein
MVYTSTFEGNSAGVSLNFRLHYFSAPSENYLKFSLQFPARWATWNDFE